ncbi:hypothetical protein GIW46_17725 [Pseudomonas syringae]|uniref:hypothetical protein n=1 Tax=Pseudomonas syringae TaxID=317 RepID=UPI002FD9D700|nr:hypothetical protein [Pseudomonas syringae]
MSQSFTELANYNLRSKTAEDKRILAVIAALEIVHAKISNTPADCNIVTDEMNNLSGYADQIQEALKTK